MGVEKTQTERLATAIFWSQKYGGSYDASRGDV